MSFLIGEITARVSADTSKFDSSIGGVKRKGGQASKSLTRNFDKVGKSMRRTGAVMTASLTVPIVMGMRSAVKESALLEGALAKFDVVFGDMAEDTRAWVDEFRQGVPLSRREIVQSSAAMQDLLVPMGIAREEATGMTKDWMQLAAALGAFNDVPINEALEAIRSGIAGQSRPLRQFGIDVRETALQQRALEMGLIGAGEEMDTQARQQALLAQAYANSKDAVDGYEDQLGTTLLMEQELQATYRDTLATLGDDLQPLYREIIGTATDLLKSFQDLDAEQRKNVIQWGLIIAAAGPAIGIFGQMLIWVNRVNKAMKALNVTMLLNPWTAAAAAATILVVTLSRMNKESSTAVKQIREEQVQLNTLVSRITETNKSQKERNELIGQLQKEYPGFLKNIDSESVTNEQLAKRLREVNQEMVNRIIIQRQGEQVAEKADRLAKAQEDVARRRVDQFERLNRVNRDHNLGLDLTNKTLEESVSLVTKELEERVKSSSIQGRLLNSMANDLFQVRDAEKGRSLAQAESSAATRALSSQEEERRRILEALGVTVEENTESNNDNTESLRGVNSQYGAMKPLIESIPPTDEFIDPVAIAEAEKELALFNQSLEDLMNLDVSVGDKIPLPGSIQALTERVQGLNEELALTNDEDKIALLNQQIREAQEEIDRLRELGVEMNEELDKTPERMQESTAGTQALGNALSQAVLHGRNLEEIATNLAKQFASRAFVLGIGALLTGGANLGGKGFFGALFGGFRAGGGSVNPNQAFMVGERGPELFVPPGRGNIVPNHQLGGTQNVNVHVVGELRAIGDEMRAVLRQADKNTTRLGGRSN